MAPERKADPIAERCRASLHRFQQSDRAADLEQLFADFEDLSEESPERAELAAGLVTAMLNGTQWDAYSNQLFTLTALADAGHPALPEWPQASATVHAYEIVYNLAYQGGMPGGRAALAQFLRFAEVVEDTGPYAERVRLWEQLLRMTVGLEDGDKGALTTFAELVRDLGRSSEAPPGLEVGTPMFTAFEGVVNELVNDDVAAALRHAEAMLAANDEVPPEFRFNHQPDVLRSVAEAMTDVFRFLDTDGEPLEAERPWPQGDDIRAEYTGLFGLQGIMTGDDETAERTMERYRRTLAAIPADHPDRLTHVMLTVQAQMLLGRRRGATVIDVDALMPLLEEARRLAQPYTDEWQTASHLLGLCLRDKGDHAAGRDIGLNALRGNTWRVLLQADTFGAHAVAREAADNAVAMANLSMFTDDPEGIITALESGRALILFAATEKRGLEARLRAVGANDLAIRWRAAVEQYGVDRVPSELRRAVVSALTGVELRPDGTVSPGTGQDANHLLDPPSTPEIQHALDTLDLDAIVYLVPGEEDVPGYAAVVPADGAPSVVELPGLTELGFAALNPFLRAAARGAVPELINGASAEVPRDLRPPHQTPVPTRDLAAVCDLAWTAAMGPLLERHLPRRADGEPVRLALVPVRELARVPWHAARHSYESDGRHRYAVEQAVFTYTASARMLIDAAARDDVPLSRSGLIVADPETAGQAQTLAGARAEAAAIHKTFYPQARLVGRRPDGMACTAGPGSDTDVLSWLTDPDGGTMARLACHAVVQAGTAAEETSYLLLADGRHLAAEELVRGLSAHGGRDIGLAVLAACNSAESGRGYDEAFSLATTFLAAGVRTVISAQWSVPDTDTSVLMFMFHHYLRTTGQRPADALRAAQLWMINGGPTPDTMPPTLREHINARTAARVESWAGFVHSGR